MKRLLYIVALFIALESPSQSFTVKKANDDYVVTNLRGSDRYKELKEIIRDRDGLYWFQNSTDVSSFDGINWKAYGFSDANGRKIPVRINEIELTDNGEIWLATAEGVFGFNRSKEKFLPIKTIFPQLKGMPVITNCIYRGTDDFLLVSFIRDGFYIFNWNKGAIKYVSIDSINKVNLDVNGIELFVTIDNAGNYWGVTKENKGIWCYNSNTGIIKCSWKGELLPKAAKRLQNRTIKSITYSPKTNSLLLSYGKEGILERINLNTQQSSFYSFSGDLNIRADTNTTSKRPILRVKVDPLGNEWLLLADQYLVRLDPDLSKCEYLIHDPSTLPLGKMEWLLPESNMKSGKGDDDILLWIKGEKGLTVLKKRNPLVRQVPFEKTSIAGITPNDYINRDVTKEIANYKNIQFVRDLSGNYLLLQQNEGRPKLIRLDKNLHITGCLFNNEWKDYPAFFNPVINSNDFYIALLRGGTEPLNFRTVVIRDFRVDLQTLSVEESTLNFAQRVWRYGAGDANNVYWLFSNGYLYSYSPQNNRLDSIFICDPASKKPYTNSRIKGYDFPTLLHKETGTFWISFISDRELFKIDLKKRKVVKVIRSCLDQPECLPSGVFQLQPFDSSWIYLKMNMNAALLNPATDSATPYSDLFRDKLPYEDHIGSLVYKDWLCSVTATQINLQNLKTGKQKRLFFNEDFKWRMSPLFSVPPVSDSGELILMSSEQRGFLIVPLDSIRLPKTPGIIRFSFIRLNGKDLLMDSILRLGSLRLKYNKYGSVRFKFSDLSILEQDKIGYEYALYDGGDTVWNKIEGDPDISFDRISPGNYRVLIRAENKFGDYSPQVTSFGLFITPPFTQTAWFFFLVILLTAGIVYLFYRYRLLQVKRLQAVRNNIASDLHDDIGSTLNSISIYSEVARQQAGKDIPALELIGTNSRKIIESMSDIVWTINPQNDSFEKIIIRMRSFAHQLLKAKKIEYHFDVDEELNSITLPMQVRKNFYLVFKEAITNLIKYSNATRVAISLRAEGKTVILKIRDNGVGIPVNPETQGNGLINMKKRAEEINASLDIKSGNEGTGVELILKA